MAKVLGSVADLVKRPLQRVGSSVLDTAGGLANKVPPPPIQGLGKRTNDAVGELDNLFKQLDNAADKSVDSASTALQSAKKQADEAKELAEKAAEAAETAADEAATQVAKEAAKKAKAAAKEAAKKAKDAAKEADKLVQTLKKSPDPNLKQAANQLDTASKKVAQKADEAAQAARQVESKSFLARQGDRLKNGVTFARKNAMKIAAAAVVGVMATLFGINMTGMSAEAQECYAKCMPDENGDFQDEEETEDQPICKTDTADCETHCTTRCKELHPMTPEEAWSDAVGTLGSVVGGATSGIASVLTDGLLGPIAEALGLDDLGKAVFAGGIVLLVVIPLILFVKKFLKK